MNENIEAPVRERAIWVVTDGRAGNEKPAKALADGVAAALPGPCSVAVKQIELKFGAAWLPPKLWLAPGVWRDGWPFSALSDRGEDLSPPYPDLVIGAGRRSAPFVLAIKKLSEGKTKAVQILDPKMGDQRFDLIITPAHDGAEGPHVHSTTGSLHDVSPEALKDVSDGRLEALGRPLIGVLVGGSSGAARLEREDVDRMIDALRPAAAAGASLAATTSRRTPFGVAERLEAEIHGFGGFYWSGEGENPYRAILAMSDALVVTADSVNMASEAAGSGKPVFIAPISKISEKLQRFHMKMKMAGHSMDLPNALSIAALQTARTRLLDDRSQAVAEVLKVISSAP